ncbi:type III pantothenate kinase, partial [Striga asiatica]
MIEEHCIESIRKTQAKHLPGKIHPKPDGTDTPRFLEHNKILTKCWAFYRRTKVNLLLVVFPTLTIAGSASRRVFLYHYCRLGVPPGFPLSISQLIMRNPKPAN